MGFPDSSVVKNPPEVQETPVGFLGREDPLKKGQDTYSSILGLPLWLSWSRTRLLCRRPGFHSCFGKIPWGRERLPTPVFWSCIIHGVTKSRARLRDFHFHLLYNVVTASWQATLPLAPPGKPILNVQKKKRKCCQSHRGWAWRITGNVVLTPDDHRSALWELVLWAPKALVPPQPFSFLLTSGFSG